MKLRAPLRRPTPRAAAREVSYRELRAMGACLALALVLYIPALPRWLTAVVAASIGMRLFLAARGRAAPNRPVRLGIAAAAIVILFLQLRTFNGLAAGTALLCLVAGLKFLETQARRDLFALALIIYFLCLSALLRSESFWLLIYSIGVAWLTAATLLRVTPSAPRHGWPFDLRYAGRPARPAPIPRRARRCAACAPAWR